MIPDMDIVRAGTGPAKECPVCGKTFTRARATYCSPSCKERRRGADPKRIAWIREKNAARYAATHPEASRRPWLLASPVPTDLYLPGASLTIAFDRPFAIQERHRYLAHGLITALLGEDHDPLDPAWRLFPVDGGSGWGVHPYRSEAADLLASRSWPGRLGHHPVHVSFRGRTRWKVPPRLRGRQRLTVTALTPVCIRCEGEYRQQPTADNFVSALAGRVARQLDVAVPRDDLAVTILDSRIEVRTSARVGKLDTIRGWVGDVDIECNAPAAWMLIAASRCTGLGSRTAFGYGAFRVTPLR